MSCCCSLPYFNPNACVNCANNKQYDNIFVPYFDYGNEFENDKFFYNREFKVGEIYKFSEQLYEDGNGI